MKEQQKFNYFYIGHRSDNTTSGLRVSKVKIHGSNDGSTFTQIDNEITLNKTQNINYPVTTSTYRYVKIEYSAWESASSTLQIAEFNLGMMYLLGRGVERDSLQAERLFRQASAQGHKYATSYLLKLEEKRFTPADSIMDLKVMAN